MKKTTTRLLALICLVAMLLSLSSCDASGGALNGGFYPMSPDPSLKGEMADGEMPEPDGGAEESEPTQLPSGMITAAAWVDNDNYAMWLDLFSQGEENGKFYQYTNTENSWGFTSLNRIKVNVKNGENPVAGATVIASDPEGNALFSAVSDAQGNAYLFTDAESGNISVKSGEGSAGATFSAEERDIEITLDNNAEKLNVIEIMLLLDVTGSMGDEMSFLKNELADVIYKIAQNNEGVIINLALLFYRDTDDKVPFLYCDFETVTNADAMNKQQTSLNNQKADGGGDYPEAVDKALEMAVNKQWSTGATTKIIFHVLDAPAHSTVENRERFQNAVKIAAEKGIRICPILCSGAAELTEYTMREAAINTGGTFIFVTDDSGIGDTHHDPDLPNVTVELLNSLMVRIVNGYHTGEFAPAVYWKDDPDLAK